MKYKLLAKASLPIGPLINSPMAWGPKNRSNPLQSLIKTERAKEAKLKAKSRFIGRLMPIEGTTSLRLELG